MALSTTPCARPQCGRYVQQNSNKQYCSGMCATLVRYVAESLNLQAGIGTVPLTDELVVKTKRFATLYDEIQTVKKKLRSAAIGTGMSPADWSSLVAGKYPRTPAR